MTACPDLRAGIAAGAFLEVDCAPGRSEWIADAASLDPRVATVERTGDSDLLLTLVAADVPTLSAFVFDGVDHLDGVHSSRLHVMSTLAAESRDARTTPGQAPEQSPAQQRLSEHARAETGVTGRFSAENRALLLALAPDGRRPVAELAGRVGTSASAVRRRVLAMAESGLIALRCELAAPVRTSSMIVHYWASAPAYALDRCVRAVTALPPVCRCTVLTGASNLLITARLDGGSGLVRLERALAERCPDVRLASRVLTRRTWKRRGWLLDERGLPVGCRPVDPWSPSPALSAEPL